MIRPERDYLANHQYQWVIREAQQFWGINVAQNELHPLDVMNMSRYSPRFISALFRNCGLSVSDLLDGEQFTYIASIDVPIEFNGDILVNGGRDVLELRGFGRWLSEVTKLGVMIEGTGHRAHGSECRFTWVVHGLMHGLTRDMDAVSQQELAEYCEKILKHFESEPFGTVPAALSMFSLLPVRDRIEVLEQLDPRSCVAVRYYEKLAMAYVKYGRLDLGSQVTNQGWRMDLFTDSEFERLNDKLEHLSQMRFDSSQDHSSALSRILGEEGQQCLPDAERLQTVLTEYCRIQIEKPPF